MRLFSWLFGKGTPPEAAAPAPSAPSAPPPFPLEEVPASDAEAVLLKLHELGQREGFTPVILAHVETVRSALSPDTPPSQVLAEAVAISMPAWFAAAAEEDDADDPVELGDWPAQSEPARGLSFPSLYFDGERAATPVTIARLPTPRSWEASAWVGFGGFNTCPDPAVQVAAARYWHERYGAEMVAVGSDFIEFTVARPPATREEAEALAREQYVFCADIVDQGVGTLRALAAGLLHGESWFFWWD